MSYTLRGRLESRLAGALLPAAGAAIGAIAIGKWWPVVLAALMVGVGLALDPLYDRLFPYQPGWVAAPLGLLELAAVMGIALALDAGAPLGPALALFAGAWLAGQAFGHAGFPFLRTSYGEDGGELGRIGAVSVVAAAVLFAFAGGVAWGTRPPTVHLGAGFHRGPIVLDHAQTLVGEDGAVVQGLIKVTADHVIVRNVTVLAGEYGIEVEHAEHVLLDDVTIRGASLDAIHVRRSQVTIHDCDIARPGGRYAQGIDISFSIDLAPSTVDGCTVVGGQEGIVTHSANIDLRDNVVRETALRGITVTEMSMGMVEDNKVDDALGIGIFCGDSSECEIERNTVRGTRPDTQSEDLMRAGIGIVVHYGATAHVDDNRLGDNPRKIGVFANAILRSTPE
ncbi:MAG TPA: right-handed parallel beta-helix repeat-containing protein [Gaiellaceae bacterium]